MIQTLHIENVGIIENLSVNLGKGLNVLTGETGAGKTLIIDSLEILAGGRFSKEMIRKGTNYSFVELSMVDEHNNEDIIVSREINENGKNMCKINGRMATVNELKEFMKSKIDIHGQHDNQSLFEIATHNELLDKFSGKEIEQIKQEYEKLYEEYINTKQEIKNNYGDEKEKQRKLDLLKYQNNEITSANLKIGEEEELETKRKVILNAEKISENLNQADFELSQNAIDAMQKAIKSLEKIQDLDEKYEKNMQNIKETYYALQEVARDINDLREDTYFEEKDRVEIEERLDVLFSLKRKYGNNIEEILKYNKEVEEQIYEIENLEEYTNKLKENLKKIEDKMQELAKKMHEIRKNTSQLLNKKINQELIDLDMKNAKFMTKIETKQEYAKNGIDKVEFLIQTNVGEEYKSLTKIASGGELSRIMLAIKNVLANVDNIPVLIFDEIDTGISGAVANKVGEKMKVISNHHQVLCITHLATIAAKGDKNYYISKEVEEERTRTSLKELSEEETIKEIARMASGTISDISLKHAQELRRQ